jgi:hypothetical protein
MWACPYHGRLETPVSLDFLPLIFRICGRRSFGSRTIAFFLDNGQKTANETAHS